jgi:TorA maturation chaperone TorD
MAGADDGHIDDRGPVTGDLAGLATRRAGIAGLLGLLLLEEPGAGIAPLVAGVPALAPLADPDRARAHAVEYERVFLRGVPLLQSAFSGEDDRPTGGVLRELTERYAEAGYDEHRHDRFRVASPDHLGLILRCHAQLCHHEAEAWRADRADAATRAVQAERRFLAEHVSGWAPVALDAARTLAASGPYRPVLDALDAFLREEHDRLRPLPLLGQTVKAAPLPAVLGPARLGRLLLDPASCGTWLTDSDIAAAARAIGSPFRGSDSRSALRHLVESACDSGELAALLGPIGQALVAAARRYQARLTDDVGNAASWAGWLATANEMIALVDRVRANGHLGARPAVVGERLLITGTDPGQLADRVDEVVAALRAGGLDVQREPLGPPGCGHLSP